MRIKIILVDWISQEADSFKLFDNLEPKMKVFTLTKKKRNEKRTGTSVYKVINWICQESGQCLTNVSWIHTSQYYIVIHLRTFLLRNLQSYLDTAYRTGMEAELILRPSNFMIALIRRPIKIQRIK